MKRNNVKTGRYNRVEKVIQYSLMLWLMLGNLFMNIATALPRQININLINASAMPGQSGISKI